jgi:glucosamine--fructose-6-phosphate aminotransferase (isomerizing)
MCGIVAYCGHGPAMPALTDGLARLEYRGYDSTGVALNSGDGRKLKIVRAAGRLSHLIAALAVDKENDFRIGIGHTRWATHGGPSKANAHPHRDCTGKVAVVHNGTIDNATTLRAELAANGHIVATEVDTELIAHLVEASLSDAGPGEVAEGADRLVAAVAAAVRRLDGSWALAVTVEAFDCIVVTRHRSPLLVGESENAYMAASDVLGFEPGIEAIRELNDGDIVSLGSRAVWINAHGLQIPARAPLPPFGPVVAATLDGAPDFTSKEIAEQPAAARHVINTIGSRLDHGRLLDDLGLPLCGRVRLVACGSSFYAAQVTARVLTSVGGIPIRVVIASECMTEVDETDTLTVAFSQSGETADVLSAMDAWPRPWLAVTNNPQSTLARRADGVLGLGCGPELGVAATKSFTAQVIAGSALAMAICAAHDRISGSKLAHLQAQLAAVPDRLAATDEQVAPIAAALAGELACEPGWIFVSRGAGMPYASEGALKLKELAYRWVEALPAGELKHGPIALVQDGTPVVVVQAQPAARLAVNVAEVAARGARTITVGGGEDATLPVVAADEEPPWGPLEAVIALQHLARGVTRHLGHDVDRPRNLAKSVTVE